MASDKKDDLPSWFEAIQILALHSVRKDTPEYRYRYVCRWFSETFSTKLEEVEALPYDYVLQHYFERQFEAMEDMDRMSVVKELLETAEERRLRLLAEESDDDWYEDILKDTGKKKADRDAALTPIEKHDLPESLKDSTNKLAEAAKKLSETIADAPEEISIDFSKITSIDQLDDWDMLGDPTKKDGNL